MPLYPMHTFQTFFGDAPSESGNLTSLLLIVLQLNPQWLVYFDCIVILEFIVDS